MKKRKRDDNGFLIMRAVAMKRFKLPYMKLADTLGPEIWDFGFRCFIEGQIYALQKYTPITRPPKHKKRRRR